MLLTKVACLRALLIYSLSTPSTRQPQNALPGVVLSLCCKNTLIRVLTARLRPMGAPAVRGQAVLIFLSRTILEIADTVNARCTDC